MKRTLLTILLWLIPAIAMAGFSGGTQTSGNPSGIPITPSSVATTGSVTAGTTFIAGSGVTTITTAAGLLKANELDNSAWAAPGAIGGTTPAAVKGTTVTATTSTSSPAFLGTGTPGIAGGGALSTGSNSFAGTVTGTATTANVLTTGVTCANATVCILGDETTAGGAKVTATSTTTCTFACTASDVVDYIASCR